MLTRIDHARLEEIFDSARKAGRSRLFEFETYELLRHSGAESVPGYRFLERESRPSDEELSALPGDRVVLKIVSPCIIHKSDVGGVRVVANDPARVRSAWRRMMDEVPENFARLIERDPAAAPEAYRGLAGRDLVRAVASDVRGALLCQFMPPDSEAFGNELLVSLRRTREFGMVVTAGLGGTDTELYAKRFRKGQAVVSAATALTSPQAFFDLFATTIAYKKLAGLTRGQKRIVSDGQLLECFAVLIELGNRYGPENPDAPVFLDELEVNPFAFTDYRMVPLDGVCRFSEPVREAPARPRGGLGRLLRPETIGLVGVSEKRANFGRVILDNILAAGFDPDQVTVLKPGVERIGGVRCVSDLAALGRVDLFVLAVGAAQVPDLVEALVAGDHAAAVLLVPGGLGETAGSESLVRRVTGAIARGREKEGGGPVFLGGNCLGVRSRPGRFDTIFIPRERLPVAGPGRPTAFVSQSGAFLVTRASKLPVLDPSYLVSVGNQIDLTVADFADHFSRDPGVEVMAFYVEGFTDGDGLAFCRAVRRAVAAGKDVVFYKAGRTPEGQDATAGHTASVAGDAMVCESCVRQAGAMVADTFTQFENLFLAASLLRGRAVGGNRLATVSGAGYEAVGMADGIRGDDFRLSLAELAPATREALAGVLAERGLSALVAVKNPLDITPAADDALHVRAAGILAADPGVDGVILSLDPLSPAMRVLPGAANPDLDLDSPGSVTALLPPLFNSLDKPLVTVAEGGALFDPLAEALTRAGIPVFRNCDRAVAALAKYMEGRLHAQAIRERG
jgi:acyl-CoA synthetase (NDP forming)